MELLPARVVLGRVVEELLEVVEPSVEELAQVVEGDIAGKGQGSEGSEGVRKRLEISIDVRWRRGRGRHGIDGPKVGTRACLVVVLCRAWITRFKANLISSICLA